VLLLYPKSPGKVRQACRRAGENVGFDIGRLVKSQVDHMAALVSALPKKGGEGKLKLIVNQQLRAVFSTIWSVC